MNRDAQDSHTLFNAFVAPSGMFTMNTSGFALASYLPHNKWVLSQRRPVHTVSSIPCRQKQVGSFKIRRRFATKIGS